MTKPTIVWGVIADELGLVHRSRVVREDLGGGHYRAYKDDEFKREGADAYASSHPAPIPMRWHHGEDIGRIVALRRAHGNLYAIGETDLEPDDLQALTDDWGELRWSTGTNRRAPLVIGEISLTPDPASVGLHPVRWCKPGSGRGDLPAWVKEELGQKVETRSRELIVHEIGGAVDSSDLVRGDITREIFYSGAPGQILSVGGRPVRR
ncbi:MAG TPA: hypothetical protein VMM14_01020 [Acidimicrobiia bacterium]|nr:hypothetical protein [Acidimicrobiia bacterium]